MRSQRVGRVAKPATDCQPAWPGVTKIRTRDWQSRAGWQPALLACLVPALFAQQPFVERPKSSVFWRPYQAPTVPPSRTTNSDRLYGLIRAGKLYLTLQDAIGLAIENNLDLEIDRYGPLAAEWNFQRQQAGGPLKGVPNGNTFVNQITAGQGINGAIQSAGLSSGNASGGGGNTNTQISQVGPITPNLDTVAQNTSAWAHLTYPQPNAILSQTTALVDVTSRFNSFVQEGLVSGGFAQVSMNMSYLNENSPNDVINPSWAPIAQVYVRHSLLNGFGTGVNSRFIRVAQGQIGAARETFRAQLLALVANIANLYWDLVIAGEDLKAKQGTLEIAQKFLDDTKARIQLGEIAGFEVFRAQTEFSSRRQEVAIAEANVLQREVLLKDALSRNGLADLALDEAEIVPLDRIQVPESDDLPSLRELVMKAMALRPDVALAKIGDESQRISAEGTANGILPSLQAAAAASARGLAGTPNPAAGAAPNPQIVGGLGTAFAQTFTGDFTGRQGTLLFSAPFKNHVAQADYGIDQLQLSQGDLIERRNQNQLVVDISNQMIALRQARARYSQAVATRVLEEQLLDKEQQQFLLGGSAIENVVAAARSLAAAQYAEVAALGGYSRARVALDQVLGQTLEVNRVSVDDALGAAPSGPARSPGPSRPSTPAGTANRETRR
ncbi:MAG: TolC family protein [Bryobacterales bacterium]|nr:TolC family protein [Bryobacterales bacterium]